MQALMIHFITVLKYIAPNAHAERQMAVKIVFKVALGLILSIAALSGFSLTAETQSLNPDQPRQACRPPSPPGPPCTGPDPISWADRYEMYWQEHGGRLNGAIRINQTRDSVSHHNPNCGSGTNSSICQALCLDVPTNQISSIEIWMKDIGGEMRPALQNPDGWRNCPIQTGDCLAYSGVVVNQSASRVCVTFKNWSDKINRAGKLVVVRN